MQVQALWTFALMGLRETWYRTGRPFLFAARIVGYLILAGYLLLSSRQMPQLGQDQLALFRTAGWLLATTALGLHLGRISHREEFEFLAMLPMTRTAQLAVRLARAQRGIWASGLPSPACF